MKKTILRNLLPVVLLSLSMNSLSAAWKPAEVSLMTPWGQSIAPGSAWPEYPRPQLRRNAWKNLNGLWDYAVRPLASTQPDTWDGQILVPFALESALGGVGRVLQPDERLWYRRTFEIPSEWKEQGLSRTLLHFGAVDYVAQIWLNEVLVGTHTGGFDAFQFDLSAYLREGENSLVVAVTDPTDTGPQPRGKQVLNPQGIWYTPVSGIWQTVWLEPVPERSIEELRLTPQFDQAAVEVTAHLDPLYAGDELAIRITVLDGSEEIGRALIPPARTVSVPVSSRKAWSPETPHLFDVQAELVAIEDPYAADRENAKARNERFRPARRGAEELAKFARAKVLGGPLDRVTGYFGMRKISLETRRADGQPEIFLNNKPLFQLGTLDQGWWPESLHTPPSDEAIVFEIEYLKESGFNMLRKHIKAEPARYYYHCDRLGLLVWQDVPGSAGPGEFLGRQDDGDGTRNALIAEQYELEQRRVMNRLHNHPSIVMWVVFNEGWGQYDTTRMARWTKELDPSRLVNPASGWLDFPAGDVFDIHTYSVVPNRPEQKGDRAIVVGEYGGIGMPLKGHLWDPDKQNWGYQTYHSREEILQAYQTKNDAIIAMKKELGLSAAVYTQTTDVESEVNGLLTYDREVKKFDPEKLAELHAPLFD